MRSFFLSLPAFLQLFFIVLGTIIVAFASATLVYLLFRSFELISKTGLITAIYTVLGTIYAVLLAFSVSGVWQNYCAAELAVTAEAAALNDLIHMVAASTTEKASSIRNIAIEYLTQVISVEWPMLSKGNNEAIMSPSSPTFLLAMRLVHEVQTIQPLTPRDNVVFSHALTLVTKWLDARRTRLMLGKGNIAKSLWPVLIAGAVIICGFHGMFVVENIFLWSTLLLLFSGVIGFAFYLIFALDSPFAGAPVVTPNSFNWALIWLKDKKFNDLNKSK